MACTQKASFLLMVQPLPLADEQADCDVLARILTKVFLD